MAHTKSGCVLKRLNDTKKSFGSIWSDSTKEISLQLAWKGKLESGWKLGCAYCNGKAFPKRRKRMVFNFKRMGK